MPKNLQGTAAAGSNRLHRGVVNVFDGLGKKFSYHADGMKTKRKNSWKDTETHGSQKENPKY